jgi:hypothetical protein
MMVRVEPGGEPPFDAELSGWLKERPRVVPVLYDPSDHRKVLLDKPAYEARKAAVRRGTPAYLLASGQRVRGVLKSFVDTGTTARSLGITPTKPELFDAPRYMLEVELHIPNLAPITSRVTQPVPQDRVPNLALGLPLTCAVDYADPQQLCVVDWDAITG